jgi:hypothetical protein
MSFEDAVRKRLNLQGDYNIGVIASGGGQYQIGDYTWDSEPYTFEVYAHPTVKRTETRKMPSLFPSSYSAWERGEQAQPAEYRTFEFDQPDGSRPSFSQEFDSVPEIWAWLEESDG